MAVLNTLLIGSLAALAGALPHGAIRRQVSELRSSYDFIIAGGGTAGLTVADRLTEAFPDKTVLVVEYGEIEYAAGIFDPPQTVWGGVDALASYWMFNTLPNPEVNDKAGLVFVGKVAGGSSAINGMFFDRGSSHDFDAFAQVGSPEFDSSTDKWNWNGIFPYFKKSVTFTPPAAEVVAKYGYTWDVSAYGGTTPIYSSFPPFLWADHGIVRDAWDEMGIPKNKECASGHKTGLCWVPNSQHPVTARRSYSRLGHYSDVNTTRDNYDLLVKHQVVRLVYPDGITSGPPVVEIRSLDDDSLVNATATGEVILSAGAFHTPTILQRSGIGPAAFLSSAGIPLVLDLPGVGSNLQDHSGSGINWNYTNPPTTSPLPSDMENATFVADATAGFDETPARGPYTLAMSNSAMFMSMPDISENYMTIVNKIRAMVSDGSAASYLPEEFATDPAMVAGYKDQLTVLADLLENSDTPSIESTFATGSGVRGVQLHPLSRGKVRLNVTNPLEPPLLDYRTGSNPVDFDIYVEHVKYLRRMIGTSALQKYGAVESAPGAGVTTDEELVDYVKDTMIFSFMHPCCTSSMLPKNKGGVVGPDLKVHGAAGLRVVDMSVIPMLPSSHLSQTAYAIGEKASDIIINAWGGTKCRR